jgi:hypothetical protein
LVSLVFLFQRFVSPKVGSHVRQLGASQAL